VTARVLDVSRTISRAGRVATGIDRVEAAYIRRFLEEDTPVFALARTRFGYVLADRDGLAAVATGLANGFVGRIGWPARLTRRTAPMVVQQAETAMRDAALGHALRGGLARLISRHVPPGSVYVNVGHGWPGRHTLAALKAQSDLRIALMVHDVIPLSHPQHQRPGIPERFRDRIETASSLADLVIHPAAVTRAETERAFRAAGRVPPGVIAPPGTCPARPGADGLSMHVSPDRPYCMALGTIEPRKRIDLLLDAWDLMAWSGEADRLPQLLLIGARGWGNETVFRRLDVLLPDDPVRELGPLCDAQAATLMAGARALLFPSEAEGYGLPPIEAAAMGAPVICRDLPVYRETLGDYPMRVTGDDPSDWRDAVETLLADPPVRAAYRSPNWCDHFNTVLSRL
jgi:glycosyltransferase involved in cell wall biosynthesis